MKNQKMTTKTGEQTPEWGTEEFKVWWESQYDYAESHYIPNFQNATDLAYIPTLRK